MNSSSCSYLEWKELVETYPRKADLFYQLGEIHERKGDKEVAVAFWKEFLPKPSNRGAGLRWREQKITTAVDDEEVPDIVSRLCQAGQKLDKSGHHIDAIAAYREALALNPLDVNLWETLAKMYIFTGKKEKAVRTYQKGIERHPLSFRLWSGVCEVHTANNGFESAIALCKHGIDDFPDSPSPILALINVYAAKGEYSNAMVTFLQLYRVLSSERRKNLRFALLGRPSSSALLTTVKSKESDILEM